MNMQELTLKKERIASIGKWALALIAAAIISPLVFLAIKGLIGLIIAGVLGLTIVNLSPWLSMKFANWKLKAIKNEAARNPVETLQNVYNQRQAQRQKFKDQITTFRAKVSGFADKVDGFKTQFPQDAPKFEQQLLQMQALLKRREAKYARVKSDLEKFAGVIQRADAIWQMGLAAAEMNAAAGVFDGEQMYERIKVETALDSVQDSMNMAFSEMESDFMEGDDIQLIEHQPGNVIDMPITVKERVA
jgi:hypothetical protein